MKKRLLLALALLLGAFTFANAQLVRDIESTVYIFANGNALVVQKWNVEVGSGTEYWIPIDNPGKSYIHDFCVYENDEKYEDDGRNWDSSRSFEEKSGRSGIVEKGGGDIELCWGLGSYGEHTYTLMYVIDDLVQVYKDGGVGFHWHFLNDEWSSAPDHVRITFINETERGEWYWNSEEDWNVRFWGFGMVGDSKLEEGKIIFESTQPLSHKSFFSAMMQFDPSLFNDNIISGSGTFEKMKKKAMKGSDYKDGDGFGDLLAKIFVIILFIVLPALILLALIAYIVSRLYMRITGNRYDKKVFGRTKIKDWWRDIPLGGSPTALYSLLQYGDKLAPEKEKVFPNLVSAYFLKWLLEGLITVEKDPKKESRVNLRFFGDKKDADFKEKLEADIYRSARAAAGNNLLLEAGEFKNWSYAHDVTVTTWPSEAKYSGAKKWQAASIEERCHAVEFMNYLKDFTIIDEREAPEVALWQQYLIMAASLGVADKVAKNFAKLFPAQMEEYYKKAQVGNIDTMATVLDSINLSSKAMMTSALSHKASREAEAAEARRSSGGGGSISFGGGGGGFGGGHGGGTR